MPEQNFLFRRFPLIAAIGIVVLSVAACAVQLRPDQDSEPSAVASEDSHPLAPKLESCLTVTPDQTATFEYCRRVWAENRRRFFGPQKKSPATHRYRAAEWSILVRAGSKGSKPAAAGLSLRRHTWTGVGGGRYRRHRPVSGNLYPLHRFRASDCLAAKSAM